MSRRIDIELTSARDDRTFTWRAAGARQPKGVVDAATLPSGSAVGDVLKVEIDTGLDGSEITQVIPGRTSRHEPERIELVADRRPTTTWSPLTSRPRGAVRASVETGETAPNVAMARVGVVRAGREAGAQKARRASAAPARDGNTSRS